MVIATGDAPTRHRVDCDGDELAALIVVWRGQTTHWRRACVQADQLIDDWEREVIASGRHYAVLFTRDLEALRA